MMSNLTVEDEKNLRDPDFVGSEEEQVQDSKSISNITGLQNAIFGWLYATFDVDVVNDVTERCDRLLEEVFEILQAAGYNRSRIPAMENYVWNREPGELPQEIAGTFVTLSALASVANVNLEKCINEEYDKILVNKDKIRAKQALKEDAIKFSTAKPIMIIYCNYKGDISKRIITPQRIWYGSTKYHPDEQYIMTAFDHMRSAVRDFAMKDIIKFNHDWDVV